MDIREEFIEITTNVLNSITTITNMTDCLLVLTDMELNILLQYDPEKKNTTKPVSKTYINRVFSYCKLRNYISVDYYTERYNSITIPIHMIDGKIIGYIGLISPKDIDRHFTIVMELLSKLLAIEFSKKTKMFNNNFGFSENDIQIINLLFKGYTDDEISQKLHMSRSLIRLHLKNLFIKMEVKNRTQLIAKCSMT